MVKARPGRFSLFVRTLLLKEYTVGLVTDIIPFMHSAKHANC